jgi:hypothetical protein
MGGADVFGGVVAGLLATVSWFLAARAVEFFRLRRYRGRYIVTRKGEAQARPERPVLRTRWRWSAFRFVLEVKMDCLPAGDWVKGYVSLDDQLSAVTRYQHMKDGRKLWGIWSLHVADAQTLVVDTNYLEAATQSPVFQSALWERADVS